MAYPLRIPPANLTYRGMAERLNLVRAITTRVIVVPERETAVLL